MPTRQRRLFLLAAFALTPSVGLGIRAAQAQPPVTPPRAESPDAPRNPRNPRNPREIADELRWNEAQNGALLLVDGPPPSQTMYGAPPRREPGLPPKSQDGLPVSVAETYFDRRIIKCGSIAAFAPTMMSVLNYQNLPKPSAYAGIGPRDRYRFLLASLTPAQWDIGWQRARTGFGRLK